jgi:hypothetical protein
MNEQVMIEWFKQVDPYQYQLAIERENLRGGMAAMGGFWGTIWEGVKVVGTEVGKSAASAISSTAKAKIEEKLAKKYGPLPAPQVPQQVAVNQQAVNDQMYRVMQGQLPSRTSPYVPPIQYTGSPQQQVEIKQHAAALENSAGSFDIQKALPWLTAGFLVYKMVSK